MPWRLLQDGEHSAAWNMAVDQAVFDAVEMGLVPSTLRLYGWARPSVTLGRFQNAARDLDLAQCGSAGIDIARRPTGGRGIVHGTDITVSVTCRAAAIQPANSVASIYAFLSRGYVDAFKLLGIDLRQSECERSQTRTGDCFQIRSGADMVTPGGEKLIGSAMRRSPEAILLQSSIRYRRPEVRTGAIFRNSVECDHYPLEHIDEADIHEAVVRGFRQLFVIDFARGDLTGWEEERTATLGNNFRLTEYDAETASLATGFAPYN